MKAVRKTLIEVLILAFVGVGLALLANTVRGSGGLELTKNYFDKGSRVVGASTPSAPEELSRKRMQSASQAIEKGSGPSVNHPDHDFQEVSFAEVVEIFNDPNTAIGANIFVDARRDEQYEAGHVPGALQADHYNLEDYIDNVLEFVDGADKIIVYCNGGECEDSIFMCNDLIEFDVPHENIYLFAGGWKAWTEGNMPVETGRGDE